MTLNLRINFTKSPFVDVRILNFSLINKGLPPKDGFEIGLSSDVTSVIEFV